jgi:imidazolonepropionase-like amidohydrolase
MPIEELKRMLAGRMTTEEVLLASTRDAAVACGRSDLGTIERGKVADIIVVDGDPIDDIRALEHVRTVIHDGAIVQ